MFRETGTTFFLIQAVILPENENNVFTADRNKIKTVNRVDSGEET